MTEKWLPIPGYAGLYEVSDLGRVWSRPRQGTKGGILKPWADHNGYPTVCLKRKFVAVHRAVALAFHADSHNPLHRQVAHLDGSRTNARADNLKWVSHAENQSHKILHGTAQFGERNGQSKITAQQALTIRERARAGESATRLGREFGLHEKTVTDIRDGKRWPHLLRRSSRRGASRSIAIAEALRG